MWDYTISYRRKYDIFRPPLTIKGAQYVFYKNTGDILTFSTTLPIYIIIGIPFLGGLIVGLIVTFAASEAKGHGVPEVMEAVALRNGRIRKRVAAAKIMASAICIGSGGSVGREGPIVQIGSSLGSTAVQIFNVARTHQKTMVGCGAAAGIAATFNAPIAGVLFALEILLSDFGIASFSPVVLSSVTATTISRHYFGDFPAFTIPAYHMKTLWEFALYPFLGLFTGLVAILFIVALYKSEDLFDAIPLPQWVKVATQAGSVITNEGESYYQAGDYLVSNNEDGTDAYCISASKFESMYEIDE